MRLPGTAGSTDPLAGYNANLPKNKTRANFRPEEFHRTLLQHGKRIVWRKAMLCPCLNPDSDQSDLGCTVCDGSGFFYVDPIEIQALMLGSDKTTRMYEKFGLWESGTVAVTVQPNYRLGYRDSLEMVDDLMNFNELLAKNDRHGLRSVLPDGHDAARYRIAQLTKMIAKVNDQIATLEPGVHYNINDSGHIVWTHAGNQLVSDGTVVSVHYDHHPVWVVTSHPHAQRSDIDAFKKQPEEVVGLPLQMSAQLDFLIDSSKALPSTGSYC